VRVRAQALLLLMLLLCSAGAHLCLHIGARTCQTPGPCPLPPTPPCLLPSVPLMRRIRAAQVSGGPLRKATGVLYTSCPGL
jgi:hypothetical protein